jgi:benzoylformate decarboxylase
VALAGDAGLALSDIAAALDDGRVAAADAAAFRAAAEADHRERSERARRRAEADAARVPVAVPALMARLVAALPPGALLVDDSVTSKAALLTHALGPGGRWRYLTTAGGSLGWGAGAALGAALARPAEPVMAVLGDGGFQFGMPALWTAVRERIAITYVVVNNRSYAAVKAAMVRLGGDAAAAGPLPATDLSGPRIADIAAGFGALGRRVDALDELDAALAAAGAVAGPSVIEVITDPDDHGPL